MSKTDNNQVTPGSEGFTPRIRVRISGISTAPREYQFEHDLRIGRSSSCDVQIEGEHVSRIHVAVELRNGQWSIRDLGSSIGMYLKNERVRVTNVESSPVTVSLGVAEPQVSFEILFSDAGGSVSVDETQWLERYVDSWRELWRICERWARPQTVALYR